MLACVLLVDCS